MPSLAYIALAAVLVALAITFGGLFAWVADLASQADADESVEVLSANEERESFALSSQEPSS